MYISEQNKLRILPLQAYILEQGDKVEKVSTLLKCY